MWQSTQRVRIIGAVAACGQQAGDERLQGEEALVWQSSRCVSLVLQQPVGNKRMRAYSQGGGSDLVRRSCGCESLVLQSVGNN